MADRPGSDTAQVKALLQASVTDLARELAPDGCLKGKYWMARNPTRDDRRQGSFWIAIRGVPGSWRDEATGEKGDIIQLIQYVRGCEFGAAMKFARAWLGLSDMHPEQIAQASQAARERRQAAEADEEAEEEKRRRWAKAHWLNAWESLLGTVAETYLRGRGIDLRKLPRQPGALRFVPNEKHAESGEAWPCIVSAMSGPKGAIHAIHRTFLARDGSDKAPVDPARKAWPRCSGAAIHLWRGKSDKPAAGAPAKSDTLVLCEGVEDGLTIALALPEARVWCAYSLTNLANIVIPACAERVIVACDNDWGKPGAEKQLAKALAQLQAQGVPVAEARSPRGKDFNDCLTGKGAAVASQPTRPRQSALHPDRLQPRERLADYLRRHGYDVYPDVSPEAVRNLAFQQDLHIKQKLEAAAC
jgi:Toprim domain